jgi:hypothetical protein
VDPFTAMMVASMVMSVVGGVTQGAAQKKAAYSNALTLESNATLADASQASALQQGAQQEGRIRMKGSATENSQQADYGASGVDVHSGSAADVGASTEAVSELDAQIAKNNAARQAWGFQVQATDFRRRAQYERDTGDMAEETSVLGGVTQGLGNLRPFLKAN